MYKFVVTACLPFLASARAVAFPIPLLAPVIMYEQLKVCGKKKVFPCLYKWCFHSLGPRPLPDFILQLWRKLRKRPGIIATPRAGNGRLG